MRAHLIITANRSRLHAAGNDTTSIMGGNYPGAGITPGLALTFGYIAGKHIAAGISR